jgi:NADPH:quinone reductase-like Zn-dependent oxidoreductase
MYERTGMLGQVFASLAELKLPPQHVGHQFAFADLPRALLLMQSGQSVGKIVVTIDE